MSLRRQTHWHSPWVHQTIRLGPLLAMRRRDREDSAYGTHDGPYQLIAIILRLPHQASLKLEWDR